MPSARDLFADLNQRFDIVGFDPRGTGQSSDAIDCRVNQETEGLYALAVHDALQPRPRGLARRARGYVEACLRNNDRILHFASTADLARDMDLLRAAVGDTKLTYLGFSYGTFLGATYASLFPHNYRALVLDGRSIPTRTSTAPTESLQAAVRGLRAGARPLLRGLRRRPKTCLGFGGTRSARGLRRAGRARRRPPAPGGRPTIRGRSTARTCWRQPFSPPTRSSTGRSRPGVAEAESGDGTTVRMLADFFYAWLPDGTYDPLGDRYFMLGASSSAIPRARVLLRAGEQSYSLFDHTWWNTGYVELPYGMFRSRRAARTTGRSAGRLDGADDARDRYDL